MAHQHTPRFLKIVDEARKRVRETNVDDVKQRLDRGEKFLLVDVRGRAYLVTCAMPDGRWQVEAIYD